MLQFHAFTVVELSVGLIVGIILAGSGSRDTPVVGRWRAITVGLYDVREGIIPKLRRSEFIGFECMGI